MACLVSGCSALYLLILQIEKLQSLLDDPEALRYNFANFDPIPLPLDPDVKIRGIVSEEALLYKVSSAICKYYYDVILLSACMYIPRVIS